MAFWMSAALAVFFTTNHAVAADRQWPPAPVGHSLVLYDCIYNFRISAYGYPAGSQATVSIQPEGSWRWKISLGSWRWPKDRVFWYRAEDDALGEMIWKFVRELDMDWEGLFLTRFSGPESYGSCFITGTEYDDSGVTKNALRNPWCLGSINLRMPGKRAYHCFNQHPSRLPEALKRLVDFLVNDVVDRLLQMSPQRQEGEIALLDQISNLERVYRAIKEYKEGKKKCATDHCRKGIDRMLGQFEDYLAEVLPIYEELGWFSEIQRESIKKYVEWQETRCARRVAGGGTSTRSDYDCRSIELRDMLRLGSLPEEVLRERAARDLAPDPPTLPWEVQLQDTSDKSQDASGKPQATGADSEGGSGANGSEGVAPSEDRSQGSTSKAQATGVAAAIALLGALLLHRLRPY
jgi:hypothetical protein